MMFHLYRENNNKKVCIRNFWNACGQPWTFFLVARKKFFLMSRSQLGMYKEKWRTRISHEEHQSLRFRLKILTTSCKHAKLRFVSWENWSCWCMNLSGNAGLVKTKSVFDFCGLRWMVSTYPCLSCALHQSWSCLWRMTYSSPFRNNRKVKVMHEAERLLMLSPLSTCLSVRSDSSLAVKSYMATTLISPSPSPSSPSGGGRGSFFLDLSTWRPDQIKIKKTRSRRESKPERDQRNFKASKESYPPGLPWVSPFGEAQRGPALQLHVGADLPEK